MSGVIDSPFEVPLRGTSQVSEIAALELAPPGTGGTPNPAYPDLTKDPAVANGWRRDSPPAAFEDPE